MYWSRLGRSTDHYRTLLECGTRCWKHFTLQTTTRRHRNSVTVRKSPVLLKRRVICDNKVMQNIAKAWSPQVGQALNTALTTRNIPATFALTASVMPNRYHFHRGHSAAPSLKTDGMLVLNTTLHGQEHRRKNKEHFVQNYCSAVTLSMVQTATNNSNNLDAKVRQLSSNIHGKKNTTLALQLAVCWINSLKI